MAGTSNYPGALDNFAEASPTNLGDEDSTGRTHSERHDDLEAAMEAVQEELGTDPSGASASTVAARFTSIESAYLTSSAASATYLTQASAASTYLSQSSASSTYVNRSVVTTSGDLIVATGSASVTRLGKGTEGYVLTSSSAGAQGLIWAEASGGATVEMSPTQPLNPDNGTLWVDTDSDVPTFTASAYALSANPTFTGVASFPDGSASAPSITNTGDTNTGIFHPADDTVAISTGGTERVRLTSTGLGIGTSAPENAVHVSGSGVVVRLTQGSDSGSNPRILATRARGSIASPTAVQSGDVLLQIDGRGYGATGYAAAARGFFGLTAQENWTDSAQGTLWYLSTTATGGTSTTEKFRLDGNGLITGTGTSLGAWTSYTPTLGGTGWAIGNGTAAGRYVQIGKTVIAKFVITFGSTSTFGAGSLTLSLPVSSQSADRPASRGSVQLSDVSTSGQYFATGGITGGDVFFIQRITTVDGLLSDITTNAPFTWASTDVIRGIITYEAA